MTRAEEANEGEAASALAAVVRDRRLALGLRQSDLAGLAGCSERFVHTVEAGKSALRLDKVLAVLGVLGVDLVLEPGHGQLRAPELKPGGTGGSE